MTDTALREALAEALRVAYVPYSEPLSLDDTVRAYADAILAHPAVRAYLAEHCPRPRCAPAEVEQLEAAMDARRQAFTEYVREWKRAVERERESAS